MAKTDPNPDPNPRHHIAGQALDKRLYVPRLRVRKDWFVGLAPDHVDHRRPDVGADSTENFRSGFREPDPPGRGAPEHADHALRRQEAREAREGGGKETSGRRLLSDTEPSAERGETLTKEAAASFKVFDDDDTAGDDADDAGEERVGGLSSEGDENISEDDYRAFWEGTDGDEGTQGVGGSVNEGDEGREASKNARPSLRTHHDAHAGWEDESFHQRPRESGEETHVYVDAHLLCTPSVADIDGDGRDELVLSVSYFFDREYYDNPAHSNEMDASIDVSKYVAGGVYVVDLKTLALKWHTHLDLSTDTVSYRAYIYSSPTLVDLDRDGKMEIVVGTSVGFLYVLRADGTTMRGFPIQMGEIQGQVAAVDLDGDGYPELIAADTRGSVAAFRRDGSELWERHLASLIAQGASVGDVDGDGSLEVVVGTSSGAIHVLRGATGEPVHPFPFYTNGRVMAPVLLTKLRGDESAMTLVAVSFDGFVYLVDGKRACRDVIDLGETSYSMPLVDDLTGNGKMDLVLATMNGVVYAYESLDTPYDPLHAWTSQVHSVNNMAARCGAAFGVRGKDRGYHDVRGERIDVPFEIVDTRVTVPVVETKGGAPHGPYKVTVTVTSPGFSAVARGSYDNPGAYKLSAKIPNRRARGRVTVKVSDASALYVEDSYSVSFHMRYYRVLKWVLVLPFIAATTALMQMTRGEGNALPTWGGIAGGVRGRLGKDI